MEFDYLYKKNRKIDVELYNAVSTDSLESIKSLITAGAYPNTTNDFDEKIIDLLDAERRVLFIEYGGQVS